MNAAELSGRVIGVDLGSRRIGVAVSDSWRSVATAVTVLARGPQLRDDHATLAGIVERYGAVAVVVGMPLSLNGAAGPAATGVLEEVEQLRRALPVPVDTVDERYTTVVASAAMRATGRRAKRQRSVIDAAAAQVLLQGWLDRAQVASRAEL
ncbi:MAG: Holliday junction resolvase RuvX [Acidimicrobiales bacterium]